MNVAMRALKREGSWSKFWCYRGTIRRRLLIPSKKTFWNFANMFSCF